MHPIPCFYMPNPLDFQPPHILNLPIGNNKKKEKPTPSFESKTNSTNTTQQLKFDTCNKNQFYKQLTLLTISIFKVSSLLDLYLFNPL